MSLIVSLEDHPVMREVISSKVKSIFPDATWHGFADVDSAKQFMHKKHIDLATADIGLKEGKSFDFIALCMQKNIPVLVFSGYTDFVFVSEATKLGVQGFVCKMCDSSVLGAALKSVSSGKKYYCSHVQDVMSQYPIAQSQEAIENDEATFAPSLTDQEKEVLRLYTQGHTIEDIAEKLCRSPHTIKTHQRNMVKRNGLTLRRLVYLFSKWYDS